MRFREIGSHLREEKRVLHCGMLLLGFAALLVLILMKFDQVWGAVSTVAGTVAPVFYGIAIAYILNVFVHFFEDVAFRPFRDSKSKAWAKVRRPLSVALAYLVVALVIVLTQLINHTKIGMAMRAVAKDFETSQLMGIKINSVISATFVIGSALAAVGSMLYFTTYPAIVPTAGAMPGLKAFVAAVFGGIGSIPGAVIGAFLIGICENFVKIMPFDGATTFVDAFTFALLIIVLVFKPTGLFGEKATDKV